MANAAQDGGVTIHDVARRAGVAVSSVSRVLNNHPDVSATMRARVLKMAADLGYSPDPVAQSLRRGSSRTIGYVVRGFENPFFLENIQGIEEKLAAAGYTLLVTSSGGDPRREVERIGILRQRRVDALILASISDRSVASRRAVGQFKGPVVLLDRDFSRVPASNVHLDHAAGVGGATTHLLQLGHRQIALVTGNANIRPTRERLRGFAEAHAAAGIEQQPDLLVSGVFSDAFARESTMRLLSLPKAQRPTALIAGGVQSTVGVLEALSDLGIQLGGELSLVVCDDLPWLRLQKPSISTVTRDGYEMGRLAADMALELLAGQPPRTITLPTRYEPRETSLPRRVGAAPRRGGAIVAPPRGARREEVEAHRSDHVTTG